MSLLKQVFLYISHDAITFDRMGLIENLLYFLNLYDKN